MEETCKDLPDECWELIINQLDQLHQWESLSLVSSKLLSITNLTRTSLKVINPLTEILSKHLQRFPCLKKLDLTDFGGSLLEALPVIASSGVEIEELNISGNSNPPIRLINDLKSKLKNIRVFRCSESYLNDNDLEVLSHCFPLLKVLDISSQRVQHITDKGIVALSKNLKRLQKIDLTGNRKISDQSVISLVSNCKHLTEIVLRFCFNVSQTGIAFAMEYSPSLNSLILGSNMSHALELTNNLNFSKTISMIDLYELTISDNLLHKIVKSDLPLKNFHLNKCKKFTFSGISALLNAYRSLKSLTLDGIDFLTDESVIHICQFIRKLISIKLDCSKLTASSFFAISSACPLLKHMEMSNLSAKNPNLYSVSSVTKNTSITSASIKGHTLSEVLHICPNLQILTIHNLFSSHEIDIDNILNYCSELRRLTIFSDKKIVFSGEGKEETYKLEYLNTQQSLGMDDQVLEMVGKRCPKLLYLNLEGCRNITEEGLRGIVENCRELRYVNLDWCIEVRKNFISWMVSCCSSLRKVICPNRCDHTEEEKERFLRQGCIVFPGSFEDELLAQVFNV